MSDKRLYTCEHYSLYAPSRSCFFCRHLTDIFYDCEGPYMFVCEISDTAEEVHAGLMAECSRFEEDADD